MIVKFFELKKKNLTENKFFLLYGNNKGLIEETINNFLRPIKKGNVFIYDEPEIINNLDNFLENLKNKSFFENEKFIIINRSTDKIKNIIEEIIEKNIESITIVLKSDNLEKKSKLRSFFEKEKTTVTIPFYEDNNQSLRSLALTFFKEKKILISQENINIIVQRCRGDRINLYNELQKIENFAKDKKQLKSEDILKLTNLSENFDISELVDNTLAKERKKTLHILNENSFTNEDSIIILKIFINKLKRLIKLQSQILNKKDVDNVISNFKPPIFWKEKEIVKKQVEIRNVDSTKKILFKVNDLELIIKKNTANSRNIVTNFILEQAI